MTPAIKQKVRRRIKENERAIKRAQEAEVRIRDSVKRSEQRSEQIRNNLRRAGLIRDP